MKSFLSKITLILVLMSTLVGGVSASIFGDIGASNPYCETDCGLQPGINAVQGGVDGLVTDRSLSQYIQDVVVFLLGFLSIIAVIYIIYAGFVLLTSGGDEEKMKTTKNTIVYVIIGLVIIWLAGPITTFVFRVLNLS